MRPYGLQPARLLCPWGFSRQEYWSGLPCPPPGDLPDPGIEPKSPLSPALQADSLLLSHQGSPFKYTVPPINSVMSWETYAQNVQMLYLRPCLWPWRKEQTGLLAALRSSLIFHQPPVVFPDPWLTEAATSWFIFSVQMGCHKTWSLNQAVWTHVRCFLPHKNRDMEALTSSVQWNLNTLRHLCPTKRAKWLQSQP